VVPFKSRSVAIASNFSHQRSMGSDMYKWGAFLEHVATGLFVVWVFLLVLSVAVYGEKNLDRMPIFITCIVVGSLFGSLVCYFLGGALKKAALEEPPNKSD